MKYFTYLDSLRAIAVILVVFHHFIPGSSFALLLGPYGVGIFFVLSGFLITRILILERYKIDKGEIRIFESLKNFYIKRSLRIIPVYYILVGFLFILNVYEKIDIKGSIFYYLFYISNFLALKLQSWIGMLSHTWSLSVEEQFYLVWPLVILFIPKKPIKYIIISTIVWGIFYTYCTHKFFGSNKFLHYQTLACIPSFALGAAVSFFYNEIPGLNKFIPILKAISIVFPLVLIVVTYSTHFNPLLAWGQLIYGIPATCFLLYVILDEESGRRPNPVFSNKFLQYIGKISYGIYLYHIPVNYFWTHYCRRFYLLFPFKSPFAILLADIAISMIITLLISMISWYLIEKPINNFRRKI